MFSLLASLSPECHWGGSYVPPDASGIGHAQPLPIFLQDLLIRRNHFHVQSPCVPIARVSLGRFIRPARRLGHRPRATTSDLPSGPPDPQQSFPCSVSLRPYRQSVIGAVHTSRQTPRASATRNHFRSSFRTSRS